MENNNSQLLNSGETIFVPAEIAQRCPVCNGFGTLKYGAKTCQACGGKGYVLVKAVRKDDMDGGTYGNDK